VNRITIPFKETNLLKDGYIYDVKVTGCNAANLCNTTISENFLVDSSPPTIGGLIEPMSWHSADGLNYVILRWAGYEDEHSGIENYFLTISSDYSGNDLSKGVLQVPHNVSTTDQEISVPIANAKTRLQHDVIYVTIMAENKVGLKTHVSKSSLYLAPDGQIKFQNHSCEVKYCNKDCTCAVLLESCYDTNLPYQCNIHNETGNINNMIQIGLNNKTMEFSPSVRCLPGFWYVSDYLAQRYEWSVSIAGQDAGYGIDDLPMNKFYDVELYNKAIYCAYEKSPSLKGAYKCFSYHFYIIIICPENLIALLAF
jgi:hypothetical protein